jgi:hypothetical protein
MTSQTVTGGYKYATIEEAKEAHKTQIRERSRLEFVKEQRRERERKRKEYVINLEGNYQNLQIMYQRLYFQFMELQKTFAN